MDTERAYSNLEKAVSFGFLTANFRLGDINIVIKNVSDKEFRILDLLRGEKAGSSGLLFDLAFCTVFINNQNFLVDRHTQIKELMEFYSKLEVPIVSKIQEAVIDINSEYIDSLEYLEGFFYTAKSRYLWKLLDINNRDKYWGVEGLCNVGINTVQENWIIINKGLDGEENYARDFNLALIVASSNNGKGAKAMSKNYEARQTELDELREEIAKYGYDKKRERETRKAANGWSSPVKTREELVKELYRQMSGEKDKHDIFIESWMKQQREAAEKAKELAENKQKEFREKLDSGIPEFVEGSRPVSSEEMKRIMERKSTEYAGASQYMSSTEDIGDKDRYLKRISSTVIRANKG